MVCLFVFNPNWSVDVSVWLRLAVSVRQLYLPREQESSRLRFSLFLVAARNKCYGNLLVQTLGQ